MTPERVQLSRVKGWRLPPDTVSVARPTKWGNPYRVADYRRMYPDLNEAQHRSFAVVDFRKLLVFAPRYGPAPSSYPSLAVIRAELAGKNLACWCPLVDSSGARVPCHADVLISAANGAPDA